jgi:CNT family concentrative nucleoside transporter
MAQEFIGLWDFISINTLENNSVLEIHETDYMEIKSNGTFQYFLYNKKPQKYQGTWEITKNIICFNYKTGSDTIRCYETLLEGENLSLQEENTSFNFTKHQNQIVFHKEKSFKKIITNLIRGLIGLSVLLIIAFACSVNRKKIKWDLVFKGLIMQMILALCLLKVPFIEKIFESISRGFIKLISFTQAGTEFLFASMITGKIEAPLVNFIVMVLPTIIFFSALTSLFYYLGILQKIVYFFAWIMKKFMKLSGSESLAAVGNVFLGQTEAPLLVRPYLDKMTTSEIFCLMSGGMATIAGGVLAAYIGFLGGNDSIQQLLFAKHLLAASVLSAPAAIISAKIIVPETEEFDQVMKLSEDKLGSNALEAISKGTTDGLKLAVNVAAMILVFTALITMGNFITNDLLGSWTGLNNLIIKHTNYEGLTLQFILGYTFSPIVWLMGVTWEDSVLVGQLLGEKTILNEFYAYKTLGEMKMSELFSEEKSIIMSTYILCGFANFASIGIQIGGIGALVPNRKALLSKLGILALIAGTLASLFTAVIVGMLI